MSTTDTRPYVVSLDGVPVEEHTSHLDALAAARDLKESAPEQMVTVLDVTAGEVVIVEGLTRDETPASLMEG